MFESDYICGLVDMDNIWKNFCQAIIDVMVESPLDLGQEITIQDELIDVNHQFLAYSS